MTKAKLTQLEKRVREHVESRPGIPVGDKFMDAFSRGKVLCRDGKERTVDDWLKTLDPVTAAQLSNLGITSLQGSETKE